MRRRDLLAAAGGLVLGGPALAQDAPTDGVTTELITYQSRGKTIRAAVFRPGANANGAGVVYMHGSGGIGGIQLTFARRFAEAGYIAVAPTYVDAAEDDGIRAERIMDAWRDCGSDAVEWLIAQGVDRGRTGIVGYSLGSYIAVDGALGNSRAAAAIGVAGGWDVYIPRVPARRIPVLIIRAERDTHVRPSSTERWRQFLVEHDASVRVQTIRGAPHLMNSAQWAEVSRRSVAFFGNTIARAS
ncbi:MAG: dienelactone hydrolase family protein [Pseudomonadota bacterium]